MDVTVMALGDHDNFYVTLNMLKRQIIIRLISENGSTIEIKTSCVNARLLEGRLRQEIREFEKLVRTPT